MEIIPLGRLIQNVERRESFDRIASFRVRLDRIACFFFRPFSFSSLETWWSELKIYDN